jgi:hypothetical protein
MKTFIAIAATAALAAAPMSALSQTKAPAAAPTAAPSSAICGDGVIALDEVLKNLSGLWAEGLGDDSAPRATMRAAQKTANYSQAQAVLGQMSQAKCPQYPKVIGELWYLKAAQACEKAKANFKTGDTLGECDKGNWTSNVLQ